MVYRHISSDLKDCALRLWNSGWKLEDISIILNIIPHSTYRWRRILDEHGTVNPPPNPLTGRTRTLTRAVLTAVSDLYQVEPDIYLDELCTWLVTEHNTFISPSALSRTLQSVGLTSKIIQKLAAERDDFARAEFQATIRDNFIGDGSQFVVVDETSKNERTFSRHRGRAPRGQRAQLRDVFVRGDRYSLCAALTIDGYIATRVVEGSSDN